MYDNTNSGVLFPEQNKKSEKSPDYTGKLDVNGKEYRLAGWKRQGKNGTFLSLKIDEPRRADNVAEYDGAPITSFDDIPF